jgi:hypothetical protein
MAHCHIHHPAVYRPAEIAEAVLHLTSTHQITWHCSKGFAFAEYLQVQFRLPVAGQTLLVMDRAGNYEHHELSGSALRRLRRTVKDFAVRLPLRVQPDNFITNHLERPDAIAHALRQLTAPAA